MRKKEGTADAVWKCVANLIDRIYPYQTTVDILPDLPRYFTPQLAARAEQEFAQCRSAP